MTAKPTAETFFAVVNAMAGGGRCGARAESALGELRAAGLEVVAKQTAAPRDGTRIVREAWADGYRRFLAVGGDGTTWEVLNGLMPLQSKADAEQASLGFLPLGTGNSFLRDFANDVRAHAMRSLIEGRSRRCDVLCLHHREGRIFFLNLLGWGFVTEVAKRAVRHKRWGAPGYVVAVLQSLLRHQASTVSFSCDSHRADERGSGPTALVCICNSRYTGGAMMMAPEARVDDGMADLIRAEPIGRLDMLRMLPRIYSGAHLQHPAVSSQRVRRVELHTEQALSLMIDGELLEVVPQAIEVLPGALEIWV